MTLRLGNYIRLNYPISFIIVLAFTIHSSCYSGESERNLVIKTIPGKEILKKAGRIDGLRNPKQFIVRGDTAAYIIDRDLNGLHRYDLIKDELSEGTGIGQGPGELRRESLGFLAPYGEEHIWLHDQRAGRIIVYTNELDPMEHMDMVGSLRALPLRDSLVASIPTRGKKLVEMLRISDRMGGNDSEEVVWSYSSEKKEIFDPISENWVLKYGPAASCGTGVIVGFDFASYLLFIRKEGVQVLDGPEEISFPQVDVAEGHVKLPSWFNPRGTLSLSCDSTRIYSLFSGRGVSRDTVRELQFAGEFTRSKRAELAARVERSKRLHVYNKNNGNFIHEIKLPVKARKIWSSEERLYLSDEKMNIITYSLNN